MVRTKEYKNLGLDILSENTVLRELYRLSSTYQIFNDVCLKLNRPVKYRVTQKMIKFCQIDYVVVGPTGIFIIEAKEWSERTLKEKDIFPLMEADKAGLIFYIKTVNKFHRKFPMYNICVRLRKSPKVKYGYVYHLTIKELYWFIMRREGAIPKKKIMNIARWLNKVSKRKAIQR